MSIATSAGLVRPSQPDARSRLCMLLALAALGGCSRAPEGTPASARPDPELRARIDEEVRIAPIRPTPQPVAPPRRTALQGVEVGADLNLTAAPNTGEAEVSLAQDRFRPRRVVAVTMTSPYGELLALVSDDRGRTFEVARIAPPPGGDVMADPWVRFDTQGIAHLAFLANVGFPHVAVSRSTDGGMTWGAAQVLAIADKPALIADDNPGSPFRDRVYVVWVIPLETIWISRSSDGGATFDPPRAFDQLNVNSVDLAVASDGTLTIAAQDIGDGRIYAWRSTDGGETLTRVTVGRLRARFRVGNPAACRRRPTIQMSLGVDRSGGPRHGSVYLTWSDYPPGIGPADCGDVCSPATPCAPDVYTARSADGGRTWSPPVQVNPSDGGGSDQFHSISAVDPETGVLYVSYHDTGLTADRRSSHVVLTRSLDGGRTFTPPLRLSTAASRSTGSFGYGDYRGMVARDGQVVSVWSDFRGDQVRGEIYANRTVFSSDGGGDGGGGGGEACDLPPGHPRRCAECGPCGAGQGDCDGDAQCASGLACADDVGAHHGYAAGVDVCVDPAAGPGGCSLPPGHPRFCAVCGPCAAGEGDCDGDGECLPGTRCVDDVGADFGFPGGIDVCLAQPGAPGGCPLPAGHPRYCAVCGPCGAGEGDCDGDHECAGSLRCTEDTGPAFGFGPRVDVCQ